MFNGEKVCISVCMLVLSGGEQQWEARLKNSVLCERVVGKSEKSVQNIKSKCIMWMKMKKKLIQIWVCKD